MEIKKCQKETKDWFVDVKKKLNKDPWPKFVVLAKLEEEILTIQHKITKRTDEITTLQEKQIKVKDVSVDIKKSETRLQQIQTEITAFLKKNEHIKANINHLQQHIKNITQKQTSVEKIGPDAPCPTCERELGDQFSVLITNYTSEIETMKLKVKNNISGVAKELEDKLP